MRARNRRSRVQWRDLGSWDVRGGTTVGRLLHVHTRYTMQIYYLVRGRWYKVFNFSGRRPMRMDERHIDVSKSLFVRIVGRSESGHGPAIRVPTTGEYLGLQLDRPRN